MNPQAATVPRAHRRARCPRVRAAIVGYTVVLAAGHADGEYAHAIAPAALQRRAGSRGDRPGARRRSASGGAPATPVAQRTVPSPARR